MVIDGSGRNALLDSCVLFPAPLRDLLVEIAASGLYQAKWSNEIHGEWIGSLLAKRPDLSRRQLERTRDLMNQAVLDCLVEGYENLVSSLRLPDPDDRHVLAAAIHGRCDAIVTFNVRHFPGSELRPHNIEAIHPDDFVSRQMDRNAASIVTSAHRCRSRLIAPKVGAEGYLATLNALGLTRTAGALRPYLAYL